MTFLVIEYQVSADRRTVKKERARYKHRARSLDAARSDIKRKYRVGPLKIRSISTSPEPKPNGGIIAYLELRRA